LNNDSKLLKEYLDAIEKRNVISKEFLLLIKKMLNFTVAERISIKEIYDWTVMNNLCKKIFYIWVLIEKILRIHNFILKILRSSSGNNKPDSGFSEKMRNLSEKQKISSISGNQIIIDEVRKYFHYNLYKLMT
jgi:tRNA G10  N-methylase Trm11